MKAEKANVTEKGFEGVWYTDGSPKKRCLIVNITFGGGSVFVEEHCKMADRQ